MPPRVAYSFVVDAGARFAYQAWHLAHSLVHFCKAAPSEIHIQCTPEADQESRRLFLAAGFQTHTITPFGDGRYCNKIAQFDALAGLDYDIFVLLDTDTIATGDLRPWLTKQAVLAKTVDAANPPITTLDEIVTKAGLRAARERCPPDNGIAETYLGNCNGGFYSIPRVHLEMVCREWRRWALWLLDHSGPLRRAGATIHVDQVSFWLALQSSQAPFRAAPSNLNYFVHMDAPHIYHDAGCDIALLHYHNHTLNVVGLIEPKIALAPTAADAVRRANSLIGLHFNNTLFWNYRYAHHPERGSGLGSRGDNLAYKQLLLRVEGAESARTILDVGCGDLEVVKGLELRDYTGVDVSPLAIERAPMVLPNGKFYLGLREDLAAADMVLCFEVLIHQTTMSAYRRVIDYACQRTGRTLLISGYDESSLSIEANSMVHFHEPLS
ncbi:MAG: hypothetical protein JSS00_10370, partial [Proteobacteria bacterium]|nr:hypothetical protein [Pseudomonadota bacterium]